MVKDKKFSARLSNVQEDSGI